MGHIQTIVGEKKTRTARAAEIGVSMQCLKNWEKSGVAVMDDQDVRKKLSKCRNLPHGLKPEWHPQTSTIAPSDSEEPTSVDIETIIGQLSTVTDKHQAQTVKLQIDGLLNAYKLREAAGKYVSKSTVEEALIRIGAAVKAAVLRMEADLPPMLEGSSPAQMSRIIRGKVDEVMASLADASSKVWEHDATA